MAKYPPQAPFPAFAITLGEGAPYLYGDDRFLRDPTHSIQRHPAMKSYWAKLLHFWEADRSLSIFLVLLVYIIFIMPVLQAPDSLGRFVGNLAFTALLIAGTVTAAKSHWMRFGMILLTVVALLVRWAAFVAPSDILAIGREASTLVMFLLYALVVAARVYRPGGPVTYHRIQGAIAVLLLLGTVWAYAYELLYLFQPGAFNGANANAPGSPVWIYYSFVTLTTMGYGDITPVHPIARSLAISEALTGQLYIAVTLARLMALHMRTQVKD